MLKLKLNNITITTDASFYHESKIASYAFWITTEGKRYKSSAVFKEPVDSAIEAEIKAILNALFFVSNLKKEWYAIRINTDCLEAKKHLDRTHKSVKFVKYCEIYEKLKKDLKWFKFKINHVKAHTSDNSKRSFVNNWCDLSAKQIIKK